MFLTSAPVTAAGFHDRTEQLAELTAAFESLAQGAPVWVAVIGRRRVGKTSLLLEAARRTSQQVDVVVLDALEMVPVTLDFFRILVLRALDALLAEEAGASFERASLDISEFRQLVDNTTSLQALPPHRTSTLRPVPGHAGGVAAA